MRYDFWQTGSIILGCFSVRSSNDDICKAADSRESLEFMWSYPVMLSVQHLWICFTRVLCQETQMCDVQHLYKKIGNPCKTNLTLHRKMKVCITITQARFRGTVGQQSKMKIKDAFSLLRRFYSWVSCSLLGNVKHSSRCIKTLLLLWNTYLPHWLRGYLLKLLSLFLHE